MKKLFVIIAVFILMACPSRAFSLNQEAWEESWAEESFEVEKLYVEAIELYKQREYEKAKVKFIQVKIRQEGFRATDEFLTRIEEHLEYEERKEDDRKEQAQILWAKHTEFIKERNKSIGEKLKEERVRQEEAKRSKLELEEKQQRLLEKQKLARQREQERQAAINQMERRRKILEHVHRGILNTTQLFQDGQIGHADYFAQNLLKYLSKQDLSEKDKEQYRERLEMLIAKIDQKKQEIALKVEVKEKMDQVIAQPEPPVMEPSVAEPPPLEEKKVNLLAVKALDQEVMTQKMMDSQPDVKGEIAVRLEVLYQKAVNLFEEGSFTIAVEMFKEVDLMQPGYKDSKMYLRQLNMVETVPDVRLSTGRIFMTERNRAVLQALDNEEEE